ncbi:MAG: purine phosphoribosyltransferase family protein [Methanomassiliicoccales archaeon]|nr:MAG: purine phosphoribosyltransferase family protein [Methanomassiliicoccales archaeon]
MLDLLKKSLKNSPIVKKGDYDYFVHPITDGIPKMEPELLDEVISNIVDIGNMDCEKIVAAEAMAIPLSVALSMRIEKPYVVIRKRRYGLPGEVSVEQVTGYSKSSMFVNGVYEGDKVLIVDDVLSTGGTLRAIVKALRTIGAEIVDTIIVFNKLENKKELEDELNLKIKTLLDVEVVEGEVVVR